MKKIQMKCILGGNTVLGLAGIRENIGHDDSLPYQAEIYLTEKGMHASPEDYRKIGTVYNDGWGGMSQVSADYTKGKGKENAAAITRIDELCRKHSIIYKGENLGNYSTEHRCDCMACDYLDMSAKQKKLNLFYMFDDDPMVIANKGQGNVYSFHPENA